MMYDWTISRCDNCFGADDVLLSDPPLWGVRRELQSCACQLGRGEKRERARMWLLAASREPGLSIAADDVASLGSESAGIALLAT